MRKPFSIYVLLILVLFQTLSGIFGGAALVLDPSGGLLHYPLEWLQHSPFSNYLVPGLFLLIVLGIVPLITFIGLLRRLKFPLAEMVNIDRQQHWSLTFSHCIGITLILWIDLEVMFLQQIHILHLIYSLLGVFIIFFANLPAVRVHYLRRREVS